MTERNPRPGMLGAFRVPSFRFQFSADLSTAWAMEMEVLLLAWYVLVETNSAFMVALLGALRFSGTLICPLFGAYADRLPRKPLLVAMRTTFALLAAGVAALGFAGALVPWHAYAVAAAVGALRSPDMVLRQSLIADTVPRGVLMSAVGFSRATLDSARIAGPLIAATLMSIYGIGAAYAAVALCYLFSAALSTGIGARPASVSTHASSPVQDLRLGVQYIRTSPLIIALLVIAFMVNLTALCITGGMLPVIARDVYGFDETGLGLMLAVYAFGALAGSLLIAWLVRTARPEAAMLRANVIWHVLLVGFAFSDSPVIGIVLLGFIGLASSYVMVPMSSCLIVAVSESYRARVMGMRQLAVLGLPLGLLGCGALVEPAGLSISLALFAGVGVVFGFWLWLRWDGLVLQRS